MRRNVFLPMLGCSLLVCAVARGQAPAPAKPMSLSKAVDQALEAGKKALLASQQPNGSWPGYGKTPKGDVQYPVGPTALAVYALLEAGEGAQSPKIEKALKWLATNKSTKTYELGLRCNVWLIANAQTRGKKGYFELLKADADALVKAVGGKGDGTYTYDSTGPNFVPAVGGDNSNSQYGVLGVWAAVRGTRYEVADEYWYKIMRHWADCQNHDGGWGYTKNTATSGTMSAAGVATMFVCYDNLFSSNFVKCSNTEAFGPIQRGLDWFDHNFQDMLNGKLSITNNVGDPYYLFYGVERVGLASGYKYFGTADWFKLGSAKLLASMQPIKTDAAGGLAGGGWTGGTGGTDVTTAFALLFLVRGRNAVLFNKLEFPSLGSTGKPVPNDWRCRPRDLAMLTNWLGQEFESTLNWQIINLKVPVKDWHDAPILYISGSLEPTLTPQDIVKLRQYVLEGGTIFSCTECGGAPFQTGIRNVYKQLLPEYEMVEIPPTDEIYSKNVMYNLNGKPKLYVITNGIRPLVIHTDEDLPKAWQLNKTGTASIDFQAAANLFFYLTDKGKLRNRGSFTWPDEVKLTLPRTSIKIVRLKWHGNWNPEPLALQRFSRMFSDDQQIELQMIDHVGDAAPEKEADKGVAVADVGKTGAKLAILSGVGLIKLEDADIAALKDFVSKGNFLLVEAAGGDKDFYNSMETILNQVYGGAIRPLAAGADVYNLKIPDGKLVEKDPVSGAWIAQMRYRGKTGARVLGKNEPMLKAILIDRQVGNKTVKVPAIFVSREDITNAGLVGYQCFGVDGYDPGNDVEGSAYRVFRNILIYAACGVDGPGGTKIPPPATGPTTGPVKPPPPPPPPPAKEPAKTPFHG